MTDSKSRSAIVVGSGPNGLAAAVTLARAGLTVAVYEKNRVIGGACRSEELIKPGYWHDVGSSIHPLAVVSPFLRTLPLAEHGLQWTVPPVAVAHPLDDGTAVLLGGTVADTASRLDAADRNSYKNLFNPLVGHWEEIVVEAMKFPQIPLRHPFLMLNFGRRALCSAVGLAHSLFTGPRVRALLGGLGAHSVMRLESPGSIAAGLVLSLAAHTTGWPMPKGGAGAISNALAGCLVKAGGSIVAGREIQSLTDLPADHLLLLDITPGQFLEMGKKQLPDAYKRRLKNYRYGPGVFKIDWILDGPIPWKAEECLSAGTVHLGGSLEEIAASEAEVMQGRHPERPFVLLAQPTLFDRTRVPGTDEIAWAYCHVPHGSMQDMTGRIENQINRFAPGFKDRIIARHVMSPADFQADNPNCVGGDIAGGRQSLLKMVLPGISPATPLDNVFLCSSSTPPGPGVHGVCGNRAALTALRKWRRG
jgi:phytoene dehydrogenase-like protein